MSILRSFFRRLGSSPRATFHSLPLVTSWREAALPSSPAPGERPGVWEGAAGGGLEGRNGAKNYWLLAHAAMPRY